MVTSQKTALEPAGVNSYDSSACCRRVVFKVCFRFQECQKLENIFSCFANRIQFTVLISMESISWIKLQIIKHSTYSQNSKFIFQQKSIPTPNSSWKHLLPTGKFKVIFFSPFPSFQSQVQAIGDWPWSPKHWLAIPNEWWIHYMWIPHLEKLLLKQTTQVSFWYSSC